MATPSLSAKGAVGRQQAGAGAPAQTRPQKPYVLSIEGILMLSFAFLFDLINILWAILDVIGVGIILGVIWNFVALWTIGLWLLIRTGQELKRTRRKRGLTLRLVTKRLVIPVIGNSIPIAKIFPFWLWAVWGALDKSSPAMEAPAEEEELEE